MILQKVTICNYRSIKELDIEFIPKCRILVGINESGKSNILKALSLLNPDIVPEKFDVRQPLAHEDPIKESYVRFVFRFLDEEVEKIYQAALNSIYSLDRSVSIISDGKSNLNLQEFCTNRREGLYSVDVLSQKKNARYWSLSKSYKIVGNWVKPTAACPSEDQVNKQGNLVPIKNYKIFNLDDFESISTEYVEKIVLEDLQSIIGQEIKSKIEADLPDCLFWEYNDKYLLPSEIKLTNFVANPDTCLPLKYMFNNAGIEDIKQAIENERSISKPRLDSFLNRVAEQATKLLHNVWQEYKTVSFKLVENGELLVPSIKDKDNNFEVKQRSDGFKRFVTFLLLVSIKVKRNEIENTLLIIDEPDISLHPSGARYLRNELIKISNNNHVVFSTHSIFMIDGDNLSRHLLVKKKDEITHVEDATESNISEEEVIYNALGCSVFDSLNKKNILFEGWTDKKLFKVGLDKTYSGNKFKTIFKDIGLAHSTGVKDIQKITPILEFAKRECLIISDRDTVAIQYKKLYEKDKGYGDWFTYGDIMSGVTAITSEDFIKNEVFIRVSKDLAKLYADLSPLDDGQLNATGGKMNAIKQWLKDIEKEERDKLILLLKDKVFSNLKLDEIVDEYFDMLTKLPGILKI